MFCFCLLLDIGQFGLQLCLVYRNGNGVEAPCFGLENLVYCGHMTKKDALIFENGC